MSDLSIYRDGRNSPARKLKKGKFGKHIVHFPSIKNKKTVVCESELEADFCLLLEHDQSVVEYKPQPDTYRFSLNRKARLYTPDFLVIYDTGECTYYEVKPNHIESDEAYRVMFNTFSELVGELGYGSTLILERQIRVQPRLDNLKDLYSRIAMVSKHEHDYLMDTLRHLNKEITIHDLVSMNSPPSFRSIANAIFLKKIACDIDTPFSQNSYITKIGG